MQLSSMQISCLLAIWQVTRIVSDCAGQLNFGELFGHFLLLNTRQCIETAHLGILKWREFILKGPIIKNRLPPWCWNSGARISKSYFLGQWFSNFTVPQNPLEGLLRQIAGPRQSLWLSSMEVGPQNLHFSQVPKCGCCRCFRDHTWRTLF